MRDGHRQPFHLRDSLRLEPGDRVVIPFSEYEDGSLAILSPHAVVPVSGPLRGLASDDRLDPAVRALRGRSADEMTALLARTAPDPRAAALRDVNPYLPARQVLAEQASAAPTSSR